MTTSQMKKAINDFKRTLDNKNKDEWWDTDREVWNTISKDFLIWFDKNKKKFGNENLLTKEEALVVLNCIAVLSADNEEIVRKIAIKLGDDFPEITESFDYEFLMRY